MFLSYDFSSPVKKWLLGIVGLLIAGSVVGSVVNVSRSLITVVSGPNKLKPIYSVDITENKIAISFDACWGVERTESILDTLDKYNVKTTFFLVNIWLEDYPEKAREIAARGHEIGLHSTTHPRFTELSREQMRKELQENHDLIKKTTGYDPILFRPPFGDYNNTVVSVTREMGYYPIQWSIDSLDWKNIPPDNMIERVLSRAKAGDIVLFHNDGKHTPEAIGPIIEGLQKRGFQIVPISQLIIKGDYYVDVNGIQRSK